MIHIIYIYTHIGRLIRVHSCAVVGGGGGAGYVGGAGATDGQPPGNAGAGSSYLAASVNGNCTGLAGNSGNGYVNVYEFL